MQRATTQSGGVQRVTDAAAAAGLDIEVVEFPQGTRTAADAAAAIGCEVSAIVKSMIFDAAGELVLALTSGSNQVDGAKLAALAGVEACGRADANTVREATGYAIGGVAPFGHNRQLRCWVDPLLVTHEIVWCGGGSARHVFAIGSADLVALAGAVEADFVAE